MASAGLTEVLARLPSRDRRLLRALFAFALLALALGVAFGFLTGLGRAGLLALAPRAFYRLLTLHGVTVFFYWLTFAQAGFVLALASVGVAAERIRASGLAWAGLVLMAGGMLASELAPVAGAVLLYDGASAVAEMDDPATALFYLGYALQSIGLILVALAAIATALAAKSAGTVREWSTLAFAAVAWAGLLIVSALAALNTFVPPLIASLGWAVDTSGQAQAWHILFHNLHYLPLMATVALWYVLVEAVAGARPILGARFSKAVFASYLLLVPPTSLYHMFLEPGLTDAVRVGGSLLSLFISVPTVLMFLSLMAALEASARRASDRGRLSWLKRLPWGDPAFAALAAAVLNLALGGVFAFVLIQERLAPLLSDTYFVPGYFHFLTVGTVTLTFLAALMHMLPALAGGGLWRPALLAKMPAVTTAGLLLFGGAGIAAGFLGAPRRVMDPSYGGAAPALWGELMSIVGLGGTLVATALAVTIFALARSLLGLPGVGLVTPPIQVATFERQATAWTGPLLVLLLVAGMYAATALAFELAARQPLLPAAG